MPFIGNNMRCNGSEARLIDCEGTFRTDYYVRNEDDGHTAGVICSNGGYICIVWSRMHIFRYAYI